MVIEVALGIVLGVLILRFWREILALGLGLIMLAIGIGVCALVLYLAYKYREPVLTVIPAVIFIAVWVNAPELVQKIFNLPVDAQLDSLISKTVLIAPFGCVLAWVAIETMVGSQEQAQSLMWLLLYLLPLSLFCLLYWKIQQRVRLLRRSQLPNEQWGHTEIDRDRALVAGFVTFIIFCIVIVCWMGWCSFRGIDWDGFKVLFARWVWMPVSLLPFLMIAAYRRGQLRFDRGEAIFFLVAVVSLGVVGLRADFVSREADAKAQMERQAAQEETRKSIALASARARAEREAQETNGRALEKSRLAQIAGWRFVGNTEFATVYANPTSRSRSGEVVNMWTIFDLKTPVELEVGWFASSLVMNEFDCRNGALRTVFTSMHSDHMASGAVVTSDKDIRAWTMPQLGAMDGDLWKIACNWQ